MKIITPSFEILQFPTDISLLEKAGRVCYLSEPKGEPEKFVKKGAKVMHNPSDALKILAESSFFKGEFDIDEELELIPLDFSLDIVSEEGRDRLA